MAENKPLPTSPQVFEFADFQGRVLRLTFTFDNTTRRLGTCTVFRQNGCLYQKVYWDLGPDGTPDTSTRQVTVPFGSSSVTRNQLSNRAGLTTFEDVDAVNFTVGP